MTQGHKTCQSSSHTMRVSVLGAQARPQPESAHPLTCLRHTPSSGPGSPVPLTLSSPREGSASSTRSAGLGATPCLPLSAFRYRHQLPNKATPASSWPRAHPKPPRSQKSHGRPAEHQPSPKKHSASQTHPFPRPIPFSLTHPTNASLTGVPHYRCSPVPRDRAFNASSSGLHANEENK